ncbi:MAG: CapA family protein [Lachnospiraceae bacterium]|nr:CapA family protein [Lachnospiraceae bacterium]
MRNKTLRVLIILIPALLIVMVALLFILKTQKAGHTEAETALSSEEISDSNDADNTSDADSDLGNDSTSSKDSATGDDANTPPEEPKSATLVFTGDILLGDRTLPLYQASGIDGILSNDLQNLMNSADICMVNEEFPFSTRGVKAEDKQFTFRTDPVYVTALTDMGIDIVTLANNHVLDYGTDALLDTFDTLDNAGIIYSGAGANATRAAELETINANGIDFGFLSASRVWPLASWEATDTNPGCFGTYDPAKLIAAIKEARDKCDYLTVFVHWGIERQSHPEDYQVNMAKMYIEAGADLVIGSHPHCLQGIQFFDGKPVFYSLGNFIFGQTTEKTAAIKVTVSENSSSTANDSSSSASTDGSSSDNDLSLSAIYEVIPAAASNAWTYQSEGDEAASLFSYFTSLSYGVTVDENGLVINN